VRQVHGQVKRKRKYPLDKAELQTFIKYHKKALKLSNAEIARRIGIKLHHANEWFGNNPKKFYPSDLFIEKWEQLKSLLQITDNRFDKAVTVFEDVKKPDTLACSGHRCKNVSANLVTVENKVLEKVMQKIENYKDFLDNYAEEYTKRIDTAKNKRENIDKQIAMIEKQLKNAKIAFEQEAYTLQEFIDRKKELNSDLEKLQEQKQQDEAVTEEEKTITIKKAVPKLEKVFASYPDFSPSEKNDLLKTVIESIMYLKEEQKTDNISIDICWLI
jgi:DNA repair exonuclease SbcCD ATPase subunit